MEPWVIWRWIEETPTDNDCSVARPAGFRQLNLSPGADIDPLRQDKANFLVALVKPGPLTQTGRSKPWLNFLGHQAREDITNHKVVTFWDTYSYILSVIFGQQSCGLILLPNFNGFFTPYLVNL